MFSRQLLEQLLVGFPDFRSEWNESVRDTGKPYPLVPRLSIPAIGSALVREAVFLGFFENQALWISLF